MTLRLSLSERVICLPRSYIPSASDLMKSLFVSVSSVLATTRVITRVEGSFFVGSKVPSISRVRRNFDTSGEGSQCAETKVNRSHKWFTLWTVRGDKDCY